MALSRNLLSGPRSRSMLIVFTCIASLLLALRLHHYGPPHNISIFFSDHRSASSEQFPRPQSHSSTSRFQEQQSRLPIAFVTRLQNKVRLLSVHRLQINGVCHQSLIQTFDMFQTLRPPTSIPNVFVSDIATASRRGYLDPILVSPSISLSTAVLP